MSFRKLGVPYFRYYLGYYIRVPYFRKLPHGAFGLGSRAQLACATEVQQQRHKQTKASGFRASDGLGFRVWGLGASGLGFRIWVWGLGFSFSREFEA